MYVQCHAFTLPLNCICSFLRPSRAHFNKICVHYSTSVILQILKLQNYFYISESSVYTNHNIWCTFYNTLRKYTMSQSDKIHLIVGSQMERIQFTSTNARYTVSSLSGVFAKVIGVFAPTKKTSPSPTSSASESPHLTCASPWVTIAMLGPRRGACCSFAPCSSRTCTTLNSGMGGSYSVETAELNGRASTTCAVGFAEV